MAGWNFFAGFLRRGEGYFCGYFYAYFFGFLRTVLEFFSILNTSNEIKAGWKDGEYRRAPDRDAMHARFGRSASVLF